MAETEDEALQRELQRAMQADALISNPLLSEIFDEYRRELTQAWRDSDARDAEGRELIWHRLQALLAVEARLNAVIEDGKLAVAQVRANGKAN